MAIIQWIIGPQLIGVLFIIVSILQKRYPPKEINSLYGYRTARSMKDQRNWDEGNRYSTRLMFKIGWILIITGLIITAVLQQTFDDDKTRVITKIVLMLIGAATTALVLFRTTDKHLKQTFGDTE